MATRRTHKPARFVCGPFEGVRDAVDAGSQDWQRYAQDALNCYLPDIARGRSLYSRPGVKLRHQLGNSGNSKAAVLHHTTTDGTEYRFTLMGQTLYRIAANGLSSTDVTPAGTVINATSRPALLSFGDSIIVNDGVDRPWIMSNLGSTPVTRTYIDYDGAGTAWTAHGRPTVAAGKLVFVCKTLNGVTARNAIMWSEEGSASTGYQQSGYDNLWELTQSDTDSLTAVVGTNSGIVVFREDSITRIEGLNVDQFQTSATFDGISTTIGCPYWATVVQVGRHIWFGGREGKVYRLSEDGTLDEPWRDMAQAVVRSNAVAGLTSALTTSACGAYHADLDVVVFALWEATTGRPRTLYVFNAGSGRYCGRWQIGSVNLEDEDSGVEVLGMGPLKDSNGRYSLHFITARAGFAPSYNAQVSRLYLTSEDVWTDSYETSTSDSASAQYCVPAIRTHLLGDEPGSRIIVHRVTTEHFWDSDDAGDSVKLKYHTPVLSASSQLTATLRVAADRDEGSHARATFGLGPNAQGRWVRITSSATFAANSTPTSNVQFGFERVIVDGQVVPDMDEY